MILDNVTNCAGLIVKAAAALHAEVFGHGDLDAPDEVPVPEGLHKRIGKAEDEHVVDRFLPEVVIDPVYVGFFERLQQYLIEFLRGRQVSAEWLLKHHPRSIAAARFDQPLHDGFKKEGGIAR